MKMVFQGNLEETFSENLKNENLYIIVKAE